MSRKTVLFITILLACAGAAVGALAEVPGLPSPAQALTDMRSARTSIAAVPHQELFVVEERLLSPLISEKYPLDSSLADLSARFDERKEGLKGRVQNGTVLMPTLVPMREQFLVYLGGMNIGYLLQAKIRFVLQANGGLYAHKLEAPVTASATFRRNDPRDARRAMREVIVKLDMECTRAEKAMREHLAGKFVYFACDSFSGKTQDYRVSIENPVRLEAYPTVYFSF